jgi:hypothetical protein
VQVSSIVRSVSGSSVLARLADPRYRIDVAVLKKDRAEDFEEAVVTRPLGAVALDPGLLQELQELNLFTDTDVLARRDTRKR